MSDFVNYYSVVQEHAKDMVSEMYDDLLDELKESSYGYSFETWERLNESFLSEYNEYIAINLRDAVEIIEQSTRPIEDQGMYMNAGDLKKQVMAMACHTYKNDLMAEFRIALKSKLQDDIPVFESKKEQIEEEQSKIIKELGKHERLLQDIEEAVDNENEKKLEKSILAVRQHIESLEGLLEKIEEEIEQAENLVDNAGTIQGEL